MNKKQAKKANDEVKQIYEDLKKEYSLEEIAESTIFPVYRTDEEEKEWIKKTGEFIKKYRLENPLSKDDKIRLDELSEKYRKEDETI